MIKIAIIGAGYIAHYHARGLREQEGVEVAVICDVNEEAAEKFARAYDIEETAVEAVQLAGREDIDGVVLCTPNAFHAPQALAFLENGKDVFIEKPLALNAPQGEQIAQAARKHKRLIMVGHMWRFDVEVNTIREIVQAGKIGQIVKTKGYGIHENWGPEGWFTQKELAGGGALADMGVHAIDTVRYLLGDPEPREVYGRIGTYYGDYDVDDSGIVVVTWENGTTSIIESGWWQPHMDGPEAATQLFGTKGYASIFPTLYKGRAKGEEKPEEIVPSFPKRKEHCDQPMYTRQMEYFIDCIRTRKRPSPGLSEGQTILRIVDGAYESSQTGQVVTL